MTELPSRRKRWFSWEQGAGASQCEVNDTGVAISRASHFICTFHYFACQLNLIANFNFVLFVKYIFISYIQWYFNIDIYNNIDSLYGSHSGDCINDKNNFIYI